MEHFYVVCYDISDQKRWRKIYKTMKGYGTWLQLSVFQCRLNREDLLKMTDILTEIMHCDEDNLIIIDIGAAENVPQGGKLWRPFSHNEGSCSHMIFAGGFRVVHRCNRTREHSKSPCSLTIQ